jgi:hypothetical protein
MPPCHGHGGPARDQREAKHQQANGTKQS